jgi:hypothetical protein
MEWTNVDGQLCFCMNGLELQVEFDELFKPKLCE